MMKTFFKYFFLMICAGSLMTACEDEMDIPQKGVIPIEGTYQTADDETVNGFIASVYYRLHGDAIDGFMGGEGAPGSIHDLRYCLEQMAGELAAHFPYTEGTEGATYSRTWSYYYQTIYYCNMIIENLPANSTASPALVERVIAEARVIRAICMMNLVQLYGNPPLADHIMTGAEGNTPAADSWAFIEDELSTYAESLPSKGGKGGQSAIGGRLTREAAYAYLGKAQLWQGKYNEAASTLYDKVIATNLYDLVVDYRELNRYTADFCDEYIWEYDITNTPGYEQSQAGMWDCVIYCLPPANLNIPDDMVCNTGMSFGYAAGVSEEFGSFMDRHELKSDGTKSPRYRATLAGYEDMLDPALFTYSGDKGIISEMTDCQGYFRIKWQNRTENLMGVSFFMRSHKNLSFMRYSEVLLNYAEAVAQGGSPGAMSGLEALNLVRRRAGLEDAPSLDMNNETYGVKAERRAELFYEGCRFIDLVRWGDAADVLKDCGKENYTFLGYKNGDNATAQSKAEWNITVTPTIGEGFKSGKNELFPIPSIVRTYSPDLEQNPGW